MVPLLLVAIALLATILVLSLFDKPIDRVLYDQFPVLVGAIAGVTWVRR